MRSEITGPPGGMIPLSNAPSGVGIILGRRIHLAYHGVLSGAR